MSEPLDLLNAPLSDPQEGDQLMLIRGHQIYRISLPDLVEREATLANSILKTQLLYLEMKEPEA